jgi:tetratricopeptide (TPR) repeat protein
MARSKSDELIGAIAGIAVILCVLGTCISGLFKFPFWLGALVGAALWGCFVACVIICSHLKNLLKKREAERKRIEQEAWLHSPEGVAWEEENRRRRRQQEEADERRCREAEERRRKQKEEYERQRKEAEEAAARIKWRLYHESKTMDEISEMEGWQFEEFLQRLFLRMGYMDVNLTPTNDQGADLLCVSPNVVRVAVQAKRWLGTVGNDAVQEVLGAMAYYGCAEGMVVTNSVFSSAAKELARKANIALCNGQWLAEQIRRFFPQQIPEFNWSDYNRMVKDLPPFSRAGGSTKTGFAEHEREQNRQAAEAEQARAAAHAAREAAEQRKRAEEDRNREEQQQRQAERMRREQTARQAAEREQRTGTEQTSTGTDDWREAIREAEQRDQAAEWEREVERKRREAERTRQEQERLQRNAAEAVERDRQAQQRRNTERVQQEQERQKRNAAKAVERNREEQRRRNAEQVQQEQERQQRNAEEAVERKRQEATRQAALHRVAVLDPLQMVLDEGEAAGYITYGQLSDCLGMRVFKIEPDGALKTEPENAINQGKLHEFLEILDKHDIDLIDDVDVPDGEEDVFICCNRGNARLLKGEYDKAYADFSLAIDLDPEHAITYHLLRKTALRHSLEPHPWIAGDCDDEAIRERGEAETYYDRAFDSESKKNFDQAIRDYSEAIRLAPNANYASRLAWMLSTCPEERVRDGRRAIQFATKACELTDWKSAWELNTLAAAYAEAGKFDLAIAYQTKALELSGPDQDP